MLNLLLDKIVWDYHKRQVNKLWPIVEEINKLDSSLWERKEEDIKEKTEELKERIKNWESLDDVLVEAFVNVKQACKLLYWQEFDVDWEKLVWNMIPYDVQILWGIVLHKWNIAEMKTWEGKTLVATLPIYLNALSWKWAHLVTVNDYLAKRDAQWMSVLYNFLWLEVWSVTKWTPNQSRREEYSKDITYVENSELWFDYLRDNLASSLEERVLLRRPLNFAIIDEADSILIDEARTPLIISQPREEATNKYEEYSRLVKNLEPSQWKKKKPKSFIQELISEETEEDKEKANEEEKDYYVDEKVKTIQLTSKWISKLEWHLWVNNLYKDIWYDEIHHIENALKAKSVFQRDKDYIVRNWQVMLVDEHTGRIMPWRRLSEWLHQAIEAKEWVVIQREARTVASITYQNFFKQYKKISWMTGTALTEEEEFWKIYKLETLPIPTNKPTIRVDKSDKVYFSQEAKWNAVMDSIKFAHEIWQPILIWTSSINTSEVMSSKLRQNTINHYVLNAKYHEQEASIIKNAGKLWSVVVATNMAGRGTDIKLDEWLNQTIAKNYASWIKRQLANGYNIEFNSYSYTELDLLVNWINEVFWSDIKEWISSNYSIKLWSGENFEVSFNNKKKEKDEVLCTIKITNNFSETISKDLHFGLFIVGTEKHESRRIDNQLRGRAGRQWDPGVSQFFVALDDEIMRKMWWDKIKSVAWMLLSKDDLNTMELTQKQFTSSIERSQKQMEGWLFSSRKHLFDYDSVVNKQRQRIYSKRDQILFALSQAEDKDEVIKDFWIDVENFDLETEYNQFIEDIVDRLIETYTSVMPWDLSDLIETLHQVVWYEFDKNELSSFTKASDLRDYLVSFIKDQFNQKKEYISDEKFQEIAKILYLKSIDKLWVDHIDEMQQLREKVGLFWYAQLDPLVMYKKESYEKFQKLLFNIKKDALSSFIKLDTEKIWESEQLANNDNAVDINSLSKSWWTISANNWDDWVEVIEPKPKEKTSTVTNKDKKIKPNESCPCWSWKKYKKCCWKK